MLINQAVIFCQINHAHNSMGTNINALKKNFPFSHFFFTFTHLLFNFYYNSFIFFMRFINTENCNYFFILEKERK